jgi:hypothetical protein
LGGLVWWHHTLKIACLLEEWKVRNEYLFKVKVTLPQKTMKYAKRAVTVLEEIPNLLCHHTSIITHLTYRTSRWVLSNYDTLKINFEGNYLMSSSLPPANATLTPSSTYTLWVYIFRLNIFFNKTITYKFAIH